MTAHLISEGVWAGDRERRGSIEDRDCGLQCAAQMSTSGFETRSLNFREGWSCLAETLELVPEGEREPVEGFSLLFKPMAQRSCREAVVGVVTLNKAPWRLVGTREPLKTLCGT